MSIQLDVKSVMVSYGSKTVLQDISFKLESGKIGCFLGPSGCGKTTLLRAIAGFEHLTAGEVYLRGKRVSSVGSTLAPEKRQIGMVFQDFALFPHLNVRKNIEFGLHGMGNIEKEKRSKNLLALVGMKDHADKYPHQISGGQQQRVALARAMAPKPTILLLDEPFSSMDTELREQIARDVRTVLKKDGITAILVTHDQFEAYAIADEVAVIGDGKIRQCGSPYEIYHNPIDTMVADFIGRGAMVCGEVLEDRQIELPWGSKVGPAPKNCEVGCKVRVLLRPDDIIHDDGGPFYFEIKDRAFRGAEYLYTLKVPGGGEILCMVQSHHDHKIGEKIGVRMDIQHLTSFPLQDCEDCKLLECESHPTNRRHPSSGKK
jgi:iron(III) transport system ATP-binding protein